MTISSALPSTTAPPALPQQRQGRGVRSEIPDDLAPLFQRMMRLRVLTAEQAHRLVEVLARHSPRNTRGRLRLLVRDGLLRAELVAPPSGGRSPYYYAPTSKSLRLLGRENERYLLARPPQHILEYLLYRNEVYATARADGWHIGSPVLTPPGDHGRYLQLFAHWARARTDLELARASGAERLRLQQELERLPLFAPKQLTFEFALRVDAGRRPTDLALLILDDPRRSIEAQLQDLPTSLPVGTTLVLRDHLSALDEAAAAVRPSSRLRRWQRALAKRFGADALSNELLWPRLWARRIRAVNPPQSV